MAACGFSALSIEPTGSLRLSIRDGVSVEKKAEFITTMRRVLRDYGLDLHRSLSEISARNGDDKSCLIVKRNGVGEVVPLFQDSGEPFPELPGADNFCLDRKKVRKKER